jgi:Uma2 family endonuclease
VRRRAVTGYIIGDIGVASRAPGEKSSGSVGAFHGGIEYHADVRGNDPGVVREALESVFHGERRSFPRSRMPIQTRSGPKLTYEDYARMPDDGRWHEIIGGQHVVSPAPGVAHQVVLRELAVRFRRLSESGKAEVQFAPIDVRLSEFDIVRPDLVAIATEHSDRFSEVMLDGPPDLAVEVLSPDTKHLDLGRKLALYQSAGVPEYWVLDPETRTLRQFARAGAGYVTNIFCDVTVPSSVFPGFGLDLTTLWDAEPDVPYGDST